MKPATWVPLDVDTWDQTRWQSIVNQTTNLESYAKPPVLGCSPMDFTSAPFPIRALRRMVGVFRNNVDSAIHNGARKLSA